MSVVVDPVARRGLGQLLSPLRRLGGHLVPQRRLFVIVVLVEVLMGTFAVLVPVISVRAAAGVAADLDGTAPWLLALGLAVLAVGGLGWTDSWLTHVLAYRVINALRRSVHASLRRLAPLGLGRRRAGDTAAAAMSDVESLEWFLAHTAAQWAASATVAAGSAVGAVVLLGPAGLLVPAAQLVVLAVPRLTLARAGRDGGRLRREIADLSTTTVEVRDSAREIVLLGLLERSRARVVRHTAAVQQARRRIALRVGAEQAATEAVLATLTVSVLLVAAHRVSVGQMTPAELPVAVTLVGMALVPVVTIVGGVQRLGEMSAAAGRVCALLEAPSSSTWVPPEGTSRETESASGGAGGVRALGLVASYPGRRDPVLRGLDLDIEPGERLAVVGASGAGKTTLLHLLGRLFEPDGGRLVVGSTSTADESPDETRRRVVVVEQHAHVFATTVRDNLELAHGPIPDDTLWEVLEDVDLATHVRALGDGLDSSLAERGASWSGGQRQRLALARGLLRDPDVLVLDEPTAHLDAESEHRVLSALARRQPGRTTVVVSHRPSTITWCDRSVLVEDGRVAADGPHVDLVRSHAGYRSVLTETPADRQVPETDEREEVTSSTA